ncbi:MAG: methylmalonyl Co-A mutase-associated GTPase MeaB [Actinomycetes bacterium]
MKAPGSAPEGSSPPHELAEGVRGGSRRALAKAITLVESTRADDLPLALALLEELHPFTGGSLRIGLSGAPGVGKSMLVEALGLHVVACGHRPAVLAIDPSSAVSGGSVLGDKTRMERLGRTAAAFIRPSPSAGAHGGVTARTAEAIEICEAAGFDVVIVETVGVGQAEAEVAGMTDAFVLLEPPFAGDGLQAIKRGSTELADVVAYAKADLDPVAAAAACARMSDALSLLRPASSAWRPRALTVSALTGQGVAELWAELERFQEVLAASGALAAKRRRQSVARMWRLIDAQLRSSLLGDSAVRERLAEMEAAVARGDMTPTTAANELFTLAGRTPG